MVWFPCPRPSAQQTVTVLCSPNVVWCAFAKTSSLKRRHKLGYSPGSVRSNSWHACGRTDHHIRRLVRGTGDPHFVAHSEGLTEFYRRLSWNNLIPMFRQVTGESYLPLYVGILGWAVNEDLLRSMNLPIPRHVRKIYTSPLPRSSGHTESQHVRYGLHHDCQHFRRFTVKRKAGSCCGFASKYAQYTRASSDRLLAGRGG